MYICIYRSNLNHTHKADRGAHTYWLEKGTVEIRPDHILNLIHYEVRSSCQPVITIFDEIVNINNSLINKLKIKIFSLNFVGGFVWWFM